MDLANFSLFCMDIPLSPLAGFLAEITLNYDGLCDLYFVGEKLAGYKRGRHIPVLPRIRPRLPRGTQQVPHDGMPRQTLTSTRAIRVIRGGMPSQ